MKGNRPPSITISPASQHAHFQLLFRSINAHYAHCSPVCSITHGCRGLLFFPTLFCDLALVWNSISDVHDQASDMSGKVLLARQVLKSSWRIRNCLSPQLVTQTALQGAEWIHREVFYLSLQVAVRLHIWAQRIGLTI